MFVNKYGWRPDLPDHRDFRLSVSPGDTAHLPPKLDVQNGMPPVWDQGDLGSCTGQAIGSVVQFLQKKTHPQWDFKPSTLFIYYNERWVENTIPTDGGAAIRTGIKAVANLGACREDLYPYDITKFTEKPNPAAYANALHHRTLTYLRVPQTVTGMKKVIGMGLPFVFGMSVYDSFESEEVAKSGIVLMPSKREKFVGGHAVACVGYDDTDRTFLVRNSWGPKWGLNGYFKIPYDYLLNDDLVCDLWYISKIM